jgi:6-methylsalicylate decarboxylase
MLAQDWIDIHAHFYPPEPQAVRDKRLHDLHDGCWCTKEVPGWEPAWVLSYMDRTGSPCRWLTGRGDKLIDLAVHNPIR